MSSARRAVDNGTRWPTSPLSPCRRNRSWECDAGGAHSVPERGSLPMGGPASSPLQPSFRILERQPDWPVTISERCGLAHHCIGAPVTLALFRYRIEDVLATCREAGIDATVFAVPTVLDVPMSNAFFSAPKSLHVGHAVGLAPQSDCAHLAAELVHAENGLPSRALGRGGHIGKGHAIARRDGRIAGDASGLPSSNSRQCGVRLRAASTSHGRRASPKRPPWRLLRSDVGRRTG